MAGSVCGTPLPARFDGTTFTGAPGSMARLSAVLPGSAQQISAA
ncbi:hypothetical protein ACFPN7_26645 [Amycolatopsis halotolerans]